MRRLLALPVLMLVGMGVELPARGPVPVESPRSQPSLEKDTPVPEARPATGATLPKNTKGTPGRAPGNQAVGSEEEKPSFPETDQAEKPAALPGITAPKPDEAALVHCEAELRKLGAVFEREQPVPGENGCGIEAPYRVEQIVKGVTLWPESRLRCDAALALARWADTVVVPASAALPDKINLTRINHGSAYVCRRRNNLPTGKMS
ncbi:MAG: extensin family protein, partial [Pseudomonadota bacterium]